MERSKSRVLVEQMLRERIEPSTQINDNLRNQYNELRERLDGLVKQLDTSAVSVDSSTRHRPEQEAQLLQEQQTIEQQLEQVRYAITQQDRAFGEAIQPRPFSVEEIILSDQVLVIAFEQRPDFLYLYAITAQEIRVPLRVEVTQAQLAKRVNTFQTNFFNRITSVVAVNGIRSWLTETLGAAVNQLLDFFSPQEILFVPHQAWHLLPLHLIQIANEPLILRYPARYIPSLQILRLIQERPPAQQGPGCLIANPSGGIIGSQKEAETIKQYYRPEDELLSGQQATLDQVHQRLDTAQHWLFSSYSHKEAGIALADGVLRAKELFVSGLRMPNSRLVVLSGTGTAQIQYTLGDEYPGFLLAGAHNVVTNLWMVDDDSTRLLMEDFYQGLADGLSPTLALQNAQRQLRYMHRDTVKARLQTQQKMSKTPFKSQYYWAGFVLIGDGK